MSYASLASQLSVEAVQRLQGTLQAVTEDMASVLFQNTLSLVDLSSHGLDYELGILRGAVDGGGSQDASAFRKARDLYQWPGRLFFALAPFADRLGASLGVEPAGTGEVRAEDLSAALAWARLSQGAATLLDMPALFDPIGDLAIAVKFMDQRGLAAHWERRQSSANPGWNPPPSFAFLGQGESPEELKRYNAGQTKRLGNVGFGFDPALRPVVSPRVYAELLRAAAGLQFVIPASHVLDSYFTKDWARSLPPNAVVATGIKGFCDGKTVREYIDSLFQKVGRPSSPVGIYGYMPATRWMQEQRGEQPKSDAWNILLTDPSMMNGLNLALRWAGPEATMRQEYVQGIPVVVVENPHFEPPLRLTVVADEQVIRANELASVYKNLQALHLGRSLFERMAESVKKGERWSLALNSQFRSFYQEAMDQSKRDIREALGLEGIPERKRVLMPDVEDDMYGSWGTDRFKEMYELVWQIFHEHSEAERWQEGMALLKLRIRDYYSVRNPCYGFCLAADKAAVSLQRWMSRKDVQSTVARLGRKGPIRDGKGRALSAREVEEKLEIASDAEAHYFFSMISAGLRPEALQIAEQLLIRYGRAGMAHLAESFRQAFLIVERNQHKMLFDPAIYRKIVDVTKALALVFPGSADADRGRYAQHLGRLLNLFRSALKSAEAHERALGNRRETTLILHRLVRHLEPFVQRVLTSQTLMPEHIVWINQAVIEALTSANLFSILPPEEREKEARYLLERVTQLRRFLHPKAREDERGLGLSALFPVKGPEPALPFAVKGRVGRLRAQLFGEVGAGLIELTYQMNVKFHEEDRPIVKKDIVRAVSQMELAMAAVAAKMDDDPDLKMFLETLLGTLAGIRTGVENKKMSPKDRSLVFQSLIDTLIHTRRFLVFPEDRAAVELAYTLRRFAKVEAFLQGSVKTPLWYFGNGNSTPPPPTNS